MIKRIFNSSLIRGAGIYAFFSMINSAIPFFLLPVLTRYLTPTDYGIISMFLVLVGLSRPFIGINLHGAISVKYFDRADVDFPKYIGNCFLLLFISLAIVSGVFWLFAGPISELAAFPGNWLWAVVFVAFGQYLILVLMTLWQVQKKPVSYGIYQILQTVANLSITIFLVVLLGKNWQGRVEAQIITMFCFALFGFIWLYKNGWVKFAYDKAYVGNALRFGVPLIPHALGAIAITYTDRLFITNMVNVAETGIYTVGWQVAQIIGLLAMSFNNAYKPWLYERLKKNDFELKVKIVKFTYLYFVAILAFAVSLAFLMPWFLRFFVGQDFVTAGIYVLWIAIGCAFSGMYYMVANYIFYAEKTHILAWVTFITALTNIGLNYFFIKKNGAIGAAQATALAFFMSFILTWLLSAKAYKMPWNLLIER